MQWFDQLPENLRGTGLLCSSLRPLARAGQPAGQKPPAAPVASSQQAATRQPAPDGVPAARRLASLDWRRDRRHSSQAENRGFGFGSVTDWRTNGIRLAWENRRHPPQLGTTSEWDSTHRKMVAICFFSSRSV